MKVRRLDTENRRDIRRFVEFPFDLYEDCPQWMPPLVSSVKATLDRRHYPFYRHSDADFYPVTLILRKNMGVANPSTLTR